ETMSIGWGGRRRRPARTGRAAPIAPPAITTNQSAADRHAAPDNPLPGLPPHADSRSDAWSNRRPDRRERSAFPQIPSPAARDDDLEHRLRYQSPAGSHSSSAAPSAMR